MHSDFFYQWCIVKKMVMEVYVNKGQVPLKVISLPVKFRHLDVCFFFLPCSSIDFLPTFDYTFVKKIVRPMQSSLSCKSQEMVIHFFPKLLQIVNRHVVGSQLKCFGRSIQLTEIIQCPLNQIKYNLELVLKSNLFKKNRIGKGGGTSEA